MNTMLSQHCMFLFSLSSCTMRAKIQERYEEEMRRAEIDPHPSGAVNRQLNVCALGKKSDLECKLPEGIVKSSFLLLLYAGDVHIP